MVVFSLGTVRMSQMWMLRWVVLLVGLQSLQADFMKDYGEIDVTMDIMWPTTTVFSMTKVPVTTVEPNPDHQSMVCSTWGNFHFKTFDGQFFQVADTCNYVLTVMCDIPISDFNIQMQRETVNGSITFNTVTIELEGTIIKITNGDITMGNEKVSVPTNMHGIQIEGSPTSLKISNKHGVTVFWEEDNYLTIELPEKYQGLTCGLCGNFNGNKHDDITVSGPAKWKVSTPMTETCEEVTLPPRDQCDQTSVCQQYLSSPGFADCYNVMDMSSYEKACVDDLCQCYGNYDCLCNTLTEISRQCTHAGGKPGTWRTEQLCPKTCPLNLQYMECGSPCKNTCSDPTTSLLCKEHCVDGCFCPIGTVEDNIGQSGCVPVNQCPCEHNSAVYQSGESYKQSCKKCVCAAGHWNCTYLECPGICSVVGGSHVTTYDGKTFTFSGNCDYILTKHSNDSDIAVVGNLAKCDPARKDTCLNSITLVISGTTVIFSSGGSVTVNGISPRMFPFTTGPVNIFQPSSSFIIADMKSLRLEIQLAPVMQLYIVARPEEKGKMSGVCGNYNDIQSDDFKTTLGIIEGTPTSFVNFWKQNCQDLEITFDNPCSLNIETEQLAKDWCSRLTNPNGSFAACHSEICPEMYYQWCVYDTCKCADIKKCMCAAVSNYAHVCAARGIILQGWMDSEPCDMISECSGNMKYSYGVTSCGSTCRSLSEQDNTCQGSFTPVDGCTCSEGSYLSEDGSCVHADQCPCYYGNQVIAPSAVFYKDGAKCTCDLGKLHCSSQEDCVAPMTFFKCSSHGEKGMECQRTCVKQDPNNCVSMGCTSGCMCPDDLLADGKGGCVKREKCPCSHNGVFYSPGEQVQQDCNTCTCTNGMWTCTEKACYGTCTIYGEGHFRTFDGRRYSFHGDCEHTITHDYCDTNPSPSFRLVTENIPCATTSSICSKSINLFFGKYEMILSEEEDVKVVENNGTEYRYQISSAGIYVVIEVEGLLNLIWDKKTSVMIQLHHKLKGKVCGLCGNFDGNANNDFMKHNGEVVTDPDDFGNSWKVKPSCPDVTNVVHPCDANPHRHAWAIKQCRIITSSVFADCHSLVDSGPYYDACERDACACDSGGDCDCLCTAVAAYAAECRKRGACVAWRRPNFCPLFCDYYNAQGDCEWHYKPCGSTCMKTCKNPSGTCSDQIPPLEGCFLQCPSERPYFREETMKCVTEERCTDCFYDGKLFPRGSVIYETTDGDGTCFTAMCDSYGKIIRIITESCIYTTTTPFTFSTTPETTTPTSTETATPTTVTITPTINTIYNNTYINRNTIYNKYYYSYHTNYCNDNTYINRNNTIYNNTYINRNTIYNKYYYSYNNTLPLNSNTYNCYNNTYVNGNTIYNYWHNNNFNNRDIHNHIHDYHTNYCNDNTYINRDNTIYNNTYINRNTIYNKYYYSYNNTLHLNNTIYNNTYIIRNTIYNKYYYSYHTNYCNDNTYINRNNTIYNNTYINRNTIYNKYYYSYNNTLHLNSNTYNCYNNTYVNGNTIYNYWHNNNFNNRDIHNHIHDYHTNYCNDNTYINRNNTIYNNTYINRNTIYNKYYYSYHTNYCNNNTYINRNNTIYNNTYINRNTIYNKYYYSYNNTLHLNNTIYNNTYIIRNTIYNKYYYSYHTNYCNDNTYINRNNTIYNNTYINRNTIYNKYYYSYNNTLHLNSNTYNCYNNTYVNGNTIYNYWHNNNFNNRDIHNHIHDYHTNYCNDNTYINRNNTIYNNTYINRNTIYNKYYYSYHTNYCNDNTYINRNNTIYNNTYINRNTIYNKYYYSYNYTLHLNSNTYNCYNNTYLNGNTIYNYWHNNNFNNRDIHNHIHDYHTNYCNDNTYINRNNTIYNNTYINRNTIYNKYYYSYHTNYCHDNTYINRNNTIYNNTYINRNTIYNKYNYSYNNTLHLNSNTYNCYNNTYVHGNTNYNYWHNNNFNNRDIHNHIHDYHTNYCNDNTYINRNNTIYNNTYINRNTIYNKYYYSYNNTLHLNSNTYNCYNNTYVNGNTIFNYWHNNNFNHRNIHNHIHDYHTNYCNDNTYINRNNTIYNNTYINRNTIYHKYYYSYNNTLHLNSNTYNCYNNTYVNGNTIYNYWHNNNFIHRNIHNHIHDYHTNYCNDNTYINRNNTIYNNTYINRNTIYNKYFYSYHTNYYNDNTYINRNNTKYNNTYINRNTIYNKYYYSYNNTLHLYYL
ncbi:mucin-5B-like [Carassius carassius]|uniref:mucin-5B-like n=1 Tax=Carassius carassius TaxID=217509 RepID=UPI0028690B54|nr:mucin-5B-like [Carassius carassius]